jgi:hypothetical protein
VTAAARMSRPAGAGLAVITWPQDPRDLLVTSDGDVLLLTVG